MCITLRDLKDLAFLGLMCCAIVNLCYAITGVLTLDHPFNREVAVVVPKMPMEMDRNGDGPVAIGTLDGKRIGTITAGMRLLSSTLDGNILQLLGKPVDHPTVKAYMKGHPFYNIYPHPERETVIFRTSDERSLNVEELVANVLQEVKKQVSALTGQQVQEVIFPVPASFNQPERRALLEAVEIAGVKAPNMSDFMMATDRSPKSPSWFSDDHLENMDHILVCTQMKHLEPRMSDVPELKVYPANVEEYECVRLLVTKMRLEWWPEKASLWVSIDKFVLYLMMGWSLLQFWNVWYGEGVRAHLRQDRIPRRGRMAFG
ncbi:hypoxia up-regulated protein 1 [Hyalella azteca]|uniref:Hypoxia up-regulated protein 1 n=1 Tax=Hyalella azteca TaxID=294128 RepID=A0A8B7NG80_HYAAZ|nr:hypoxia up-regulated protein 1 [Hyalella azteca]